VRRIQVVQKGQFFMQVTVESPPARELGLIAATFTPFHRDRSLNLGPIAQQAEALHRQGLRGVFVCGSTGEGSSLTTDERMAVAQRWCEVAGQDLEVIVHVGHASLEEARALAAHAERSGAAGVAAVAPFYFRPRTVPELVDCCAHVAAAAPQTRFYYYHIPVLSGVDLPMMEFLPLAAAAIPNFAGIKFTDEELAAYALCVERGGAEYEVFFGRDEMLLAGLSMGSRSAVGSTYGFAAPLYQRVFEAFHQGNFPEARRLQLVATHMIETAAGYGGLPAFKAMMRWFGEDCGPCRLPLASLDDPSVDRLRADLESQGFFTEVARTPVEIGIDGNA
jgi:N-acetylneuraminate lyase